MSIERVVTLSKAMGDPNRLRIVGLVMREAGCCVCELVDTLGLSQPLVSKHLRILKAADVLETFKEGKWNVYRCARRDDGLYLAYCEAIRNEVIPTLPPLCACTARG